MKEAVAVYWGLVHGNDPLEEGETMKATLRSVFAIVLVLIVALALTAGGGGGANKAKSMKPAKVKLHARLEARRGLTALAPPGVAQASRGSEAREPLRDSRGT